MSSDNVASAVAKRLKYYLDIQRREDAFDLSGPQHPERNHPFVRPGSSLAYDGLHDRSLKHYYREKGVKQKLQKMREVEGMTGREKQVKKKIERTLKEYSYRPGGNNISPYAMSLLQPRKAPEPYFRSRKSTKKKQRPHVIVGKTAKVGRRAPDEKVSPHEKDRLVNMATKLIVATETIALPKSRKPRKGAYADSQDSFPVITGIERRTSSASDPGPRTMPYPPKRKHPTKSAREKRLYDTTSDEVSLDSTLDSVRSQMQHLGLSNSKGDRFLASHDQTANIKDGSESQLKPRPKSAGEKLSQSQIDSDLDDFYAPSPSDVTFSQKRAWKAVTPPLSVDSSTQTLETRGTQTELETENNSEHQRTGSKITATNEMSHEIQTQNEAVHVHEASLQGGDRKVLPYEIYVVTGDKLGAGTSSDVKIIIFGHLGSSGERPLIRSRSNKTPFERNQVDLFTVDSTFLGDLEAIRIGHNGTALGTGWFLDRVVIRDENSPKAFEFKCERWLSARDDDGQIVRDLPMSNTIQAHEIPQIKDAKRMHFQHRSSSFSLEGKKILFRPLSATKDKAVANRESGNIDGKEPQPSHSPIPVDSSSDEEDTRNSKEEKEGGEIKHGKDDSNSRVKQTVKARGEIKVERNHRSDDIDSISIEEKEKETKMGKNEKKKHKKLTNDAKAKKDKAMSSSEKRHSNDKNGRISGDDEMEEKEEEPLSTKEEYKGKKSKEEEDMNNKVEPLDDDETRRIEKDSSSDSDSEQSSSSDSELFSVTSSTSSHSESESESEKSADEDEVERVAKDTTKKKDSTDESKKESVQDDYMAGFLAGIRANERDVHKETEPKESVLTTGANIHQAVESSDIERVKALINEVPELKSKPDERGWTPLHIATGFGHLEILKWLSVNGVNLEEQTPTGFTALHLAAMNGHVKCIMVLAAMGCPIGCRAVDDSTPLHLAAISGHVECVKWLLANRANPNVRRFDGRTPLDLAVEYQQDECIELLQLMKSEMERKDSVITKLRRSISKDVEESAGGTTKGTESGIENGDPENGEDGWMSDVEGEVIGRGDRVSSAKSRGQNPSIVRKKSKQEERAIEEMEEKRRLYEKQQRKMQRKESSFLDSIRQEVDSGDDDQNF